MKMLVHRAATTTNVPFSLAALKGYLRVDSSDDDATISSIGMTAAADIEHFSQLALLTQTVRVTIFDPVPCETGLGLPVGPVADDATITITIDGVAFTDFEFCGGTRPYIRWMAAWYDLRPQRLVVVYEAGFGATQASIPSDLATAVMDQAALIYDGRSPIEGKAASASPHMARIGARYRGVAI